MPDSELETLLSPFTEIIADLEATGDPRLAAFAARARTIQTLGSSPELRLMSPILKTEALYQTMELTRDLKLRRIKGTEGPLAKLDALVQTLRPPPDDAVGGEREAFEFSDQARALSSRLDQVSARIDKVSTQHAELGKVLEKTVERAAEKVTAAQEVMASQVVRAFFATWIIAVAMLGWLVYKHW